MPKVTLEFDSWEEAEAFRTSGKATRRKKADGTDDTGPEAPAPMQPPAAAAVTGPAPTFAPPAAAAVQQTGFPAANAFPQANGPSPAVAALVERINKRIDGAIASGQPVDQILAWFRGQCGVGYEQATLDQIKQAALPKLPEAQLTEIAKLMNA